MIHEEASANSFVAESLDDLLRGAIEAVFERGEPVAARKGQNLELRGVMLQLTKPRARLSRSVSRGKVFSALGELLWYLGGTNATEFITYFIPAYKEFDEDGVIFGGYGPRLCGHGDSNQLERMIHLLQERPSTRQAVIPLLTAGDLIGDHKDVPCTCDLQFFWRTQGLDLVVYMRSNDAFVGLPHDIFCFTMIQELVARAIGAELGQYIHFAGSLHIYDANFAAARAFLDEGWFSTTEMDPMPPGDPIPAINELLELEARVRLAKDPVLESLPTDPYWADLANLLVAFALDPLRRESDLALVRTRINSKVFDLHIADRIDRKSPRL